MLLYFFPRRLPGVRCPFELLNISISCRICLDVHLIRALAALLGRFDRSNDLTVYHLTTISGAG